MNLMDKDSLLKDLCEVVGLVEKVSGESAITKASRIVIEHIEEQPTVDATPVVHAYWVSGTDGHGYPFCFCSECNEDAIFKDIYSEHIKSPFCPSCGAKMDGKEASA